MSQVLGWALFDLANTFFAVAMVSFYFPLWITKDLHAPEIWFSIALTLSTLVVAVALPFCGAVSDATGERMRFLRWTTYVCVIGTSLVALTSNLWLALLLFGVANIGYQLGAVFYDAMLWQVAASGQLGHTSGLGASFGYVGSILGLVLLWPFVNWAGYRATFIPSALLFVGFALPTFLTVRDPQPRRTLSWPQVARAASLRLAATIRSARALGGLWRFFCAAFFSLNAINTILVFMAVYTSKVAGLSDQQVIRFFVVGQVCAVIGSLTVSRLIPRLGAKQTLGWIWVGWIVALTALVVRPSIQVLWIVGPVLGFCLGPTWATSRVLLVQLSPKDQLAEMLGLAGLFGKASSMIGPLVWGLIVRDPSRYGLAVLVMIGFLIVGVVVLRGVPEGQ